jgi:hypothetical protein
MSDFTPGPWRHDTKSNIGNMIVGPVGKPPQYEGDDGYRSICLVQHCCPSNLAADEAANQAANIRLIAAAPDLLAALESAVPYLETLHSLLGIGSDARKAAFRVVKDSRAALTKAKEQT